MTENEFTALPYTTEVGKLNSTDHLGCRLEIEGKQGVLAGLFHEFRNPVKTKHALDWTPVVSIVLLNLNGSEGAELEHLAVDTEVTVLERIKQPAEDSNVSYV